MRVKKQKLVRPFLCGIAASAVMLSGSCTVPAPPTALQAPMTGGGASGCSGLIGSEIGGAKVENVDLIAAGSLAGDAVKIASDVCRVHAWISSTPGSVIKMQVWLPSNWNGKMLSLGGGGFNGGLFTAARKLPVPVNKGYAGMATDAGHEFAIRATWALNQPEKLVDFGYRANHLAAVAGKAIIAAYYGTRAKRAYFQGCSNGGRDALMLAQRYPQLYDGIIAGAPANNWTGLFATFLRLEQVVRFSPGVDSLGPKLGMVRNAALKQCDALDGVSDGLISNATRCHFDPAVLTCRSEENGDCLSKQEVTAFQSVYNGTHLHDGRELMPGFPPGSEYEWPNWFTAPTGGGAALGPDFYRFMVYDDPDWDVSKFDLDRDYLYSKAQIGAILDATDPDLRPFARLGGKLLMYHGWDDAAIPAESSINYYEAARGMLGRKSNQLRLFMVPGLAHCSGGRGPNTFDSLSALDAWVEQGKPPERLIASRYEDDAEAKLGRLANAVQTRPICAWPKTPQYKGLGSINDEENFVCR